MQNTIHRFRDLHSIKCKVDMAAVVQRKYQIHHYVNLSLKHVDLTFSELMTSIVV